MKLRKGGGGTDPSARRAGDAEPPPGPLRGAGSCPGTALGSSAGGISPLGAPREHPRSTQGAPREHPRRARGAADIFRALPAAALGGWGVCSGLEGGIRALPTQRPQPGSAAFKSAAHTDAPGWRRASTAWVRVPGASWRGVGMGQGVLLLGKGAGSFPSWRSAASHPLLGWGQKGRDNSRQKQVAWTCGQG